MPRIVAAPRRSVSPLREILPGRILDGLVRSLPPVLMLVAGYLLWNGSHAPGGAFQAGAVISAAGVLLVLGGWHLPTKFAGTPVKILQIAGIGTFVLVALITTFTQGRMLQYSPTLAGTMIMIMEGAATISIGVILTALFVGGLSSGNGRK